MPKMDDQSAITVSLKWLIGVATLLMTIASSGGVLLYEVHVLQDDLAAMRAEQTKNREAIISLTATLQGQGVLK